MTKEDKQIIDRATKENWRIGDRTRLKRLLEKNLKLYRENVLLGERCNQLLKDKGDLTEQIADIKANCDLAIEGRDIKIKKLEEGNKELKKLVQQREQRGLEVQEDLLKEKEELEETINKLREQFALRDDLEDKLKKENAELKKENAGLKKEIEKHKWNDIFLEDCAGYDKKIAEEYTTLQERIEKLEQQIEKMKCCANCKSFKGYGETCEGWGEPVLNLNCDCTEWELRR